MLWPKYFCLCLAAVKLKILTRLDCCNSFLPGSPRLLLGKFAARLILKACERDHVSPLLRILHWLPIQACIEYKLSTLCLSFADTAPVYLSGLHLLLFDSRTLHIPQIRTKTSGHHSFFYAAPAAWNSLPHEIGDIQLPTAFKTSPDPSVKACYIWQILYPPPPFPNWLFNYFI